MQLGRRFAALGAAIFAIGVHGIIYDYNGIALPPSSVLVSTHGLYGASNGVSAFVKATLSFSQGYNSGGRLTAPEKLQMIFLKVRGTSALSSRSPSFPLRRHALTLRPPSGPARPPLPCRCRTRSIRAHSTALRRCAAALRAPAVD